MIYKTQISDFPHTEHGAYTRFIDNNNEGEYDLECCDSAFAVLSHEQWQEWVNDFKEKASELDDSCIDFNTSTAAFPLDDNFLVLTSDDGGDGCVSDFEEFCESKNIPSQFCVDSPLFNKGDFPDDIYTGMCDDNLDLIKVWYDIQHPEEGV